MKAVYKVDLVYVATNIVRQIAIAYPRQGIMTIDERVYCEPGGQAFVSMTDNARTSNIHTMT